MDHSFKVNLNQVVMCSVEASINSFLWKDSRGSRALLALPSSWYWVFKKFCVGILSRLQLSLAGFLKDNIFRNMVKFQLVISKLPSCNKMILFLYYIFSFFFTAKIQTQLYNFISIPPHPQILFEFMYSIKMQQEWSPALHDRSAGSWVSWISLFQGPQGSSGPLLRGGCKAPSALLLLGSSRAKEAYDIYTAHTKATGFT